MRSLLLPFSKARQGTCIAIEHFDEFVDVAFQRFGKPQNHRQARHLHAAFEIADERMIRPATLSKLRLRQIAR